MEVLFIEAEYTRKVELCPEALEYLKQKNYRKIGLYASVQFVSKLENVKKQLQEHNIEIITSRPDRTSAVSQLLGCDNYRHSLNLAGQELAAVDAYLYIGDGKFHPLALVFVQKNSNVKKEVIVNDPIANRLFIVNETDVAVILNRYKSSLMKFLTARKIGIIITVKPGQEQFKPALELEKKFPDKKLFYFIDNNISFNQLENFPFIETWVNTACPRIGLDDQEKFVKGVINLNDALRAEEILRCWT
ncbi:MAG TPA: diphthamide synthesis protein [Candidatus Nanoarchaeia archaeon]|nr:diphthamide synthesis protein [Candidatus Nanoarchaeia archaeon]